MEPFQKQPESSVRNRPGAGITSNFVVNNLLLIFGLVMAASGLIMQVGYHMHEQHPHTVQSAVTVPDMDYEQSREFDQEKTICGFGYRQWSVTHKLSIVIFTLLMLYHTWVHRKWYITIIGRRLMHKHIQVITLSVLFLLVAVSGIVPWLVDLSGGSSTIRMVFIEIHDKIALILLIYLVLHIARRTSWFSTSYEKLRS